MNLLLGKGMLLCALLMGGPSLAFAIINPPASPDTTSAACQVLSGATNLRYYGFFASAIQWQPGESYFDEVRNFTNVTWPSPSGIIVAGGSNNAALLAYLKKELDKARNAGQKAVVGGWSWDTTTWRTIIVPFLR